MIRAERPVLGGVRWFTLAYLLAAAGTAFLVGNQEFIFYIVVMLVLCGVVVIAHRRIDLIRWSLWGLSLWGLAHMAGGLVPVPENWPIAGDQRVLYSWWLIDGVLKYDQITHAYGFGITTWVCWQGIRAASPGLRPTPGVLLLCAAAGMGFGALNEVVEFVATLTMPSTNVGGYENTGWDMVANLVGCSIAACCIGWLSRGDPGVPVSDSVSPRQ